MDFKYKIADVAKEFGMPAKKVVETVSGVTGEAYKTVGTFEEKELNVLLETLTRENAETSLDAYLASGKEEAKPAPKAEPKKPEAKKAEEKKPAAQPAKAEQPKAEAKPEQKPEQKKDRKPEKQAEKRNEKRVTLQELAADTGIKEPVKTEQVQVNRAQVSVDTRTVDVNVDKFNARYDDLADSRNMPSSARTPPPAKKKSSTTAITAAASSLAAAVKPKPSACSASSWKRPATPSSRSPSPMRSPLASWLPA